MNEITVNGDIAHIKLTQGKIAIIDTVDVNLISKYQWRYANKGARSYLVGDMGHFILTIKRFAEVDHINHNRLDNRRINLRLVDRSQNNMNRRKTIKPKSSQYKGVEKKGKNIKKWRAGITYYGNRINLGYYDTEIKAAEAYNRAALKYHGEFAKLNEIS